MKNKRIYLHAEDPNVGQEIENSDIGGLENVPVNTADEELDQEINEEFDEANEELNESTPVIEEQGEEESIQDQPEEVEQVNEEEINTNDEAENIIEDVAEDVEQQEEVLDQASQVSQDFDSVFNDDQSNVLGDTSTISESLDDESDREMEKSEELDFNSTDTNEDSASNNENLSETENEEDQNENEEIVEFGEDNENDEEEEGEAEKGESAADKTKEELENSDEDASEYKEEVAEGLGKEEVQSFDDIFNDAMETAIKTDPKAESVVVIAYDKESKTPEIKNINVDKFRQGTFKDPSNPENQESKDLLVDSIPVPVETDKTTEEQKILLDEKIKELEENEIKEHLEEKKNSLTNPKGKPDLSGGFTGGSEFEEFKNLTFEEELLKQQEQIAQEMGDEKKKNESQYLKDEEQAKAALKLFAESDAIRRAMQPLPMGVPDQIFLSDLMGISGVGEYEPSANMIKYYGKNSGFQGHFANKAISQISFEDVDTLTGLLSDLNGVFVTIYNLLPSKKEAEQEAESTQKSNFEKAYDILKFYARVRGFVEALVYNRHLIVQDIQFLKDKVENLNSTQEDMLKFYGIEMEFARMKYRSSKFSEDLKIKKNLSNIKSITYNFSQDVKIALKALFTLEKSIVFFDNDVRLITQSINTTNPLEAIKTVDHVILFITRLFEVKLDLFQSLVGMKESLVNLKNYREDITGEIRKCEKLTNYYELVGMNISIPKIWLTFTVFVILFWAGDLF